MAGCSKAVEAFVGELAPHDVVGHTTSYIIEVDGRLDALDAGDSEAAVLLWLGGFVHDVDRGGAR